MAKNAKLHMWLDKHPLLDPKDEDWLETQAAVHEFGERKLSRDEAEAQAYKDYQNKHSAMAAAHHLVGLRASQGEEAQKHSLMYALHVKAMGYDPSGPVPDAVKAHMNSDQFEHPVRFKAHKGDALILHGGNGGHDHFGKSEDLRQRLEKLHKAASYTLTLDKLSEMLLEKGERPFRSAAFRHRVSGDVVETGAYHNIEPWLLGGAVNEKYDTCPGNSSDWEAGFVSHDGRFFNREEAAQHVGMQPKRHPITGNDDMRLDSSHIESGLGKAEDAQLEKAMPERTAQDFTREVLEPFGWPAPQAGKTGHWGSTHSKGGMNWKGYSQSDLVGKLSAQRQMYFLSQLGLASYDDGSTVGFGYRPGTEFEAGYKAHGAPSIDEVKQKMARSKALRQTLGAKAKPLEVPGKETSPDDYLPIESIDFGVSDDEIASPNFQHRAKKPTIDHLPVMHMDNGRFMAAENDELLHYAKVNGYTHVPASVMKSEDVGANLTKALASSDVRSRLDVLHKMISYAIALEDLDKGLDTDKRVQRTRQPGNCRHCGENIIGKRLMLREQGKVQLLVHSAFCSNECEDQWLNARTHKKPTA